MAIVSGVSIVIIHIHSIINKNGTMILMINEKYFWGIVIDLMLQSPGFVEFATQDCCPTFRYPSGEPCSPRENLENIACMELEYLEEYEGISF